MNRGLRGVAGLLAIAASLAGTGAAAQPRPQPALAVLSTRPDTVSGGDVLVGLSGAAGQRVLLNGKDVTAEFRPAEGRKDLVGRLGGLKLGHNELRLAGPRGETLALQNHPLEGPIFSGPHQKPFICETAAAGLGPARDANCSASTQVSYFYVSATPAPNPLPSGCKALNSGLAGISAGSGKMICPLADPSKLPADVARTTTTEGKTLPYVVRLERGVINRAIYEIAFLHDGSGPVPTPWKRSDGWNGRLIYTFGGGQAPSYHQGDATAGVLSDLFLRQGYAVASASLDVLQTSGNDVISAETALMVKEHFAETYGPPRYTIGFGGSGGAIQQYMMAQNYPGILDGILPSYSYSDIHTGLIDTDQRLFYQFFRLTPKKTSWTAPAPPYKTQEDAVSGSGGPGQAIRIGEMIVRMFPPFAYVCPPVVAKAIPKDQIYDPKTNPRGLRCTLAQNQVNLMGVDPHTGYAYEPLYDNVGVQYGLETLNKGQIDIEQFLELNEKIGGKSADGELLSPHRDQPANPKALYLAYRKGRVFSGVGADATPILTLRSYGDLSGDIHTRVIDYVIRARLTRANGHALNQVIFMGPPTAVYSNTVQAEGLAAMDNWLAKMEQAPAGMSRAERVKWARGALEDACWTSDGAKIVEHMTHLGGGQCNKLYPEFSINRLVAGMPFYADILKCQLKAPDPRDYKVKFSAEEWARLRKAFPDGVCDWSKPGVGQVKLEGAWLRYDAPPTVPGTH